MQRKAEMNSLTVLGCPEVSVPNGSYVSNGTSTSRTFLCKSGSVFPDSRERKRTLECRNGKWNETVNELPDCVGKSAADGPAVFIQRSIILRDNSVYYVLLHLLISYYNCMLVTP